MEIIEKAIRAVIAVKKPVVRVVEGRGDHMRRRNVVAAVVDHALKETAIARARLMAKTFVKMKT